MTFQIRTAERQGARLLIQLSGVSGSGKTYSALQLAYGLAGNDGHKIVGIDTENRRMSLNANCLPDGAKFRVLDFFPPFSPTRYIEAIEAACHAGAEVIVIDSVTHEWEGVGGCEEMANLQKTGWLRVKPIHRKFVSYMLQCPAHIIACTRARTKVEVKDEFKSDKNRTEKTFIDLGLQPIQEKNFSFEATVSLLMHDQGQRQDVLKCPPELQKILGRGRGFLTPADGAALRAWVDGAAPIDPALEQARGLLINAAEGGVAALQAAWEKIPNELRRELKDFKATAKASAEAYDQARAASRGESEVVRKFNEQILDRGIEPLPIGGATTDAQESLKEVQ